MKRDMELIRKILINVQNGDFFDGVEGFDEDAVNYHKALLIERGLLEGKPIYSMTGEKAVDIPSQVMIKKITWEGHDLIDYIQDEKKWEQIKDYLSRAGKNLNIENIKVSARKLFDL